MTRIAPVNLPYNPKTLWFDAGEMDISIGDHVVVKTARGTEFGTLADAVFEATPEQVKKLKSSLKPVERIATEEDCALQADLERKAADALPLFKELAAQTSKEMRPVSVEYLFDGDKAVFYFESENRVDFRDLVRTLSSKLHIRIDMRQIGPRDEARMVGGLGHCGQELCCKRLGGEFCPVSIRMAKEQDLSLNPQKISGVCGRLMCCLRYEYEAYKDFKSRAPKKNATIETPDGPAKVVDLDVPREVVSLRVEGEKPVRVPLSDFDEPDEGSRPRCVGCEAWDRANAPAENALGAAAASFATPQLSGKDQLAERGSVRHVPGGKKRDEDSASGRGRSGKQGRRNRRGKSSDTDSRAEDAARASQQARKPRRRRSTKVSAAGDAVTQAGEARRDKPQAGSESKTREEGKSPRSSQQRSRRGSGKADKRNAKQVLDEKQGAKRSADDKRATKRAPEGGKPSKRSGEGKQKPAGGNRGGQASGKQSSGRKQAPAQAGGPRPGQKSSGLARQGTEDAAGSGKQAGSGNSHRRQRRRSHRSASGDKPAQES